MKLDEHPDLVDKYADQLSKEIADEIDWGIIKTMLKSCGWTEIKFSPIHPMERANQIKNWVKTNCKGNVKSRHDCFMFEHEKDAVNFVLKWAN